MIGSGLISLIQQKDSDMAQTIVPPLCVGQQCKHWHINHWGTCDAFPDSIPDEVLFGEFDHREPYPGDHGIQYEPTEQE